MIDVAIPSNSNIRKKEHEEPEKYQGLSKEPKKMLRMKATVVPVAIKALGAMPPNLGKWLHQTQQTTSKISVHKSTVVVISKTLHRTLKLPGL